MEEFSKIIKFVCDLPKGEFPLISVHLSIVHFGYHIWSESPVQCRVYPAVIINPEDEWRNSENDKVISKSIAIRDAVCLMQKLSSYARHTHDVDEYYVRQDALRLLEISKYIDDEDIEKSANKILAALDELNSSKNK